MSRIKIKSIQPSAYSAMYCLENYITNETSIPITIKELVKIRISQINRCEYCIKLHSNSAIQDGETRLPELENWSNSKVFNEQEKAAINLAEKLTLIHHNGLSDAVYDETIRLFGEEQTAQLIMIAVTINAWNRIAIATNLT